jgi:hypothetical protein
MPQTRPVWLKALGTAKDPFDDKWSEQHPEIFSEVRFPLQPSGIKSGDLLVYYASGKKKLFAVARSTMNGASAAHEMTAEAKQWAYVLKVQVLVAIPDLRFAVPYETLGKSPGAVSQKSHIELSDAEYGLFVDALNAKLLKALDR